MTTAATTTATITTTTAPLSFLAWLATATATDDPAGDLISDLRDDGRKPVNFPSCAALRRYLISRHACREALAAAPAAWRRFEAGES
jgi:hypothetical protein